MEPPAALAGFDLRQRGNLLDLDRQFHAHWALGRNFILGWSPGPGTGILLLVVPHYAIAEYALGADGPAGEEARRFITGLLSGPRLFSARQIHNAARLLGVEPRYVTLRQALSGGVEEARYIEQLVHRYGISYVPGRAVALFDIVGFGLLDSFEQMTQLNSLSHSLNSAHSRMLGSRLHVDFARSSTGDGFYIWNRELGLEANTNLYHFMHLALADNAIAQSKARGRSVPSLRACFHIGGCYEFHHAEGLNPTVHSEIVGDVTIELARMIERALPGQILVGEFESGARHPVAPQRLNALEFIDRAQQNLARLNGLELSGDAIESIKCYLTGHARPDGTFTVRRLVIADKHGLTHNVFNAKVNIYRRAAEPILLGIEDRMLLEDGLNLSTAGHIVWPPGSD
jgi:hypothetical protein